MTVTDANGSTVFEKELNYGTCFSWTANNVQLAAGTQLTVMVENAQLFELAFRDANGRLVPVTGGGALFDEQTAVPDTISQLNSMYFDEIYHGRTGYEQLHKMPVYETTHPPLGKDLIMVGIALFGMTAFGWRFAGTLFGVLLVPLAWCFVRRLTRKPWAAVAASVLLALDFMRFSQSRLATIDVYGTFFILLGAYCMVWYCQRVLTDGVNRALLPMALGGIAFGLGCAARVDRHLRRGRAGRAVSGRALCALAAEKARLPGGVPHRGGGRRAVLCAAAALPLHWVLFAVLVARSGVQPQRLVAVPGVDVQLPCDAEGDPPV